MMDEDEYMEKEYRKKRKQWEVYMNVG